MKTLPCPDLYRRTAWQILLGCETHCCIALPRVAGFLGRDPKDALACTALLAHLYFKPMGDWFQGWFPEIKRFKALRRCAIIAEVLHRIRIHIRNDELNQASALRRELPAGVYELFFNEDKTHHLNHHQT